MDLVARHHLVHPGRPGGLRTLDATGHCPNLSAPEETIAATDAFAR